MNTVKFKSLFIVCVAFSLISGAIESQAAPSINDLQKKYEGINHFDALIEQTKKIDILTQPMKSTIRITLNKTSLTWKSIAPVAAEFTIDERGIGGSTQQLPANDDATKKTKAIVSMVSAMIRADLKELEKDFIISWESLTLTALPKKESGLYFFKSLTVLFDQKLEPVSFSYATDREQSELKFIELVYGRNK